MVLSLMKVKLYASWVHNLKEKRMIVKSLCDKLSNKFNISIIESEAQDIHQTIIITIAFLVSSNAMADSVSEKIINYIENNTDAEIVDVSLEQR